MRRDTEPKTPGTVLRGARGMCGRCYDRYRRSGDFHVLQRIRFPAFTGTQFPPVEITANALCGPTNAHLFDGETPEQEATAIDICNACPARDECAQWSIKTAQPQGVWGATTPKQRHKTIKETAA